MSQTKIVKCNCSNEFQDKEYGTNNRLANNCSLKGKLTTKYRCTCCGVTHDKSETKSLAPIEPKKKKKNANKL